MLIWFYIDWFFTCNFVLSNVEVVKFHLEDKVNELYKNFKSSSFELTSLFSESANKCRGETLNTHHVELPRSEGGDVDENHGDRSI